MAERRAKATTPPMTDAARSAKETERAAKQAAKDAERATKATERASKEAERAAKAAEREAKQTAKDAERATRAAERAAKQRAGARAEATGADDLADAAVDPMAAGIRRSIELLWGGDARPTRGPKPGLTVEGIVAAAIDVADRDGLAGLSMASVAKEVGFTTMSLYRYVQSKDELMMLMLDAGLGRPPAMDDIGDDWRGGLARWARACRDAFLAHPWSLQVPITGPPIAPNNVRWLDAGLRVLASTALAEDEKASIVLLVSGFVRSEAKLVRDLSDSDDPQLRPDGPTPTYGDALRLVATAEEFPALFTTIESGAFDDGGEYGDGDFEFGLERVLDGVGVLVAARERGRRAR